MGVGNRKLLPTPTPLPHTQHAPHNPGFGAVYAPPPHARRPQVGRYALAQERSSRSKSGFSDLCTPSVRLVSATTLSSPYPSCRAHRRLDSPRPKTRAHMKKRRISRPNRRTRPQEEERRTRTPKRHPGHETYYNLFGHSELVMRPSSEEHAQREGRPEHKLRTPQVEVGSQSPRQLLNTRSSQDDQTPAVNQRARRASRSTSSKVTARPSRRIQPRETKSASDLFTVSREAPTSCASSS